MIPSALVYQCHRGGFFFALSTRSGTRHFHPPFFPGGWFDEPLRLKQANPIMSSRISAQGRLLQGVLRNSSSRLVLPQLAQQQRHFATPVPPVTQDATGSKGPTAMVFLNMGGPSTTNDVGDFLSRLFVSPPVCPHASFVPTSFSDVLLLLPPNVLSPMAI